MTRRDSAASLSSRSVLAVFAGRAGAALLLTLLASWPYLATIRFWPMTTDAGIWLSRSALFREDWWGWVFSTHHFNVGFRPLTALSFSFDYALAGFDPLVYRLTDLLFHCACTLLVYVLCRLLAPDHKRWVAGAAALIMATHPAVQQVVPFLARRSYSLSTMLALASLVCACWTVRRFCAESRGLSAALGSAGAALLLAAALLANEVAYPTALVLPLLALHCAQGDDARVRRRVLLGVAGPSFALTLLALAWRISVIGGLGGYASSHSALDVLVTAWLDLVSFHPTLAEPSALERVVSWSLLVAYLVALALGVSLARRKRARIPLFVSLFVWLALPTIVFATQGVWFPRQLYPMLPPFAISLALLVGEGVRAPRGARPKALLVALPLVVALALLFQSPSIRGPSATRVEAWRVSQQYLDDVIADLSEVEGPAVVHTVLRNRVRFDYFTLLAPPGPRVGAPRSVYRQVVWLSALFFQRDVWVDSFISVPEAFGEQRWPRLQRFEGRPTLVVAAGNEIFVRDRSDHSRLLRREAEHELRIPLDAVERPPGRPAYVYVNFGKQRRLIRLPEARS